MYPILRSLLFRLDAEASHNLVLNAFSLASRFLNLTRLPMADKSRHRNLSVEAMGIHFPNPVGLAAGLDKQGSSREVFRRFGFGFVEAGTVTPLPQPGNPRPRLFRLPEHRAIINRMGFNSVGLEQFKHNLERNQANVITGINIGKNVMTPISEAVPDYLLCLRGVYELADYITINISSPNTRDLKTLQHGEKLGNLLASLNHERGILADQTGQYKPLVVKVAPDLNSAQVDFIAGMIRLHKIDGIIATNTTIYRKGIEDHPLSGEAGGLSGAPLREQATRVIDMLYRNLQNEIPIIGTGGISDSTSALEKFQAGACLVQLYTGFIYQGPALIDNILDAVN